MNEIQAGKICPYCDKPTVYVDSKEIYHGKSYGMIYFCRPCKAWVGVHKGTDNALGRLANEELRKVKMEAHKCFDLLWKSKQMSRDEAYKFISERLHIPIEETHIGMLDVKQCEDVAYFSKQLLNDLRRLDMDFGAKPSTEYFDNH